MQEETYCNLLRLLEKEPNLSQREIARRMGSSLGKVNYCLHALAEKGFIKAGNFYRSKNKKAYFYKLTAKGMAEKAKLAVKFLRIKEAEYIRLSSEIESLRAEVSKNSNVAAESKKTK